jgi:hypothetical protein
MRSFFTSPIYLSVTIDTECDKGPKWLIKRPLQFKAVTEGIPDVLEQLFRKYQVKATYLLSPEVIKDDACVSVLKDVSKGGAELGTHLHGEFIEPYMTEDTDATWAMQNTYSEEIEYEKIRNLTLLFESKFGYKPRSFRAGRYGIGKKSLNMLAEQGYLVDSSVAPNCRWKDKGGEATFYGAPVTPYYPNANDPLMSGKLSILEVPLTIGKTWWHYFPSALVRTVNKYPRLWLSPIHRLNLIHHFTPIWLRPTWFTFEQMKDLILDCLKKATPQGTVFVMMFHNVEAVPGCSPSIQDQDQLRIFMDRMESTFQFFNQLSARSLTLSEIQHIYKKDVP